MMQKTFWATVAALSVIVTGVAISSAAPPRGGNADPRTLGGQLKTFTSPYYNVYTDLGEDDVKESVIRMTKMAEEYHDRTKYLFSGQISQKLPFYLYAKPEDYYKAGGLPRSAGVFTGDSLMAMAMRDRDGRVGIGTWHVVQHEGFHQFVHAVIRGDIPIWTNEGLAEYFGEGIFTGDGIVTGIIPASRLKRVQEEIKKGDFKSVKEMMLFSHTDWNAALTEGGARANYDMAWSMVHFLAQAENGKYQDPFAKFLVLIGKGNPWDRAWVGAFGSVEGFEGKWKEYWLVMPENPTLDLYAKAVVSTLTSFLGRAYSQKQTFDTMDEFTKLDGKALKAAPADWLPPGLFNEMKLLVPQLEQQECKFSLIHNKGPLPSMQCLMGDGTRLTGTFTLGNGRIGKVNVELVKPATTKPAAAVKGR